MLVYSYLVSRSRIWCKYPGQEKVYLLFQAQASPRDARLSPPRRRSRQRQHDASREPEPGHRARSRLSGEDSACPSTLARICPTPAPGGGGGGRAFKVLPRRDERAACSPERGRTHDEKALRPPRGPATRRRRVPLTPRGVGIVEGGLPASDDLRRISPCLASGDGRASHMAVMRWRRTRFPRKNQGSLTAAFSNIEETMTMSSQLVLRQRDPLRMFSVTLRRERKIERNNSHCKIPPTYEKETLDDKVCFPMAPPFRKPSSRNCYRWLPVGVHAPDETIGLRCTMGPFRSIRRSPESATFR